MSAEGQIVLPADLRRMDGIEPGQEFDVQRAAAGNYRLVRSMPPRHDGVVAWLLGCPGKGFFVAVGSESTKTL